MPFYGSLNSHSRGGKKSSPSNLILYPENFEVIKAGNKRRERKKNKPQKKWRKMRIGRVEMNFHSMHFSINEFLTFFSILALLLSREILFLFWDAPPRRRLTRIVEQEQEFQSDEQTKQHKKIS